MINQRIEKLYKNLRAVLIGTGLTLATLVLLVMALSIYIHAVHSESNQTEERHPAPRIFVGQELVPVSVGSHEKLGSRLVIKQFYQDQAVFKLPRHFESSDYPFIELRVSGNTPHLRTKIMWKTATSSDISSQFIALNRGGYGRIFLGNNPEYRGSIHSIALLFFDGPEMGVESNGGEFLSVHSIKLVPSSPTEVFIQLLSNKLNIAGLGASSNNLVRESSLFPPVTSSLIIHLTFFTVLLFVVGTILVFRSVRTNSALVALATSFAICLALQDVARWKWRYDQHLDIAQRYSGVAPQARYALNHTRCAIFPDDCGVHLKPYF